MFERCASRYLNHKGNRKPAPSRGLAFCCFAALMISFFLQGPQLAQVHLTLL